MSSRLCLGRQQRLRRKLSPVDLRSKLEHRLAPLVVGLVAVAIVAPSLALGFVTDDYGFHAVLHARPPVGRPAWDLFRFTSGDRSVMEHAIATARLPWWTAPDFRLAFLRPLAGLSFAADDGFAPGHPVVAHAVSLLWFGTLLVTVANLYRRLFAPGLTATLALLFFALSPANASPAAWLSARHVLIAAVPIVVALDAHARAVEEGFTRGRFVAPIALAVALAASEVGVCGLLFWWSYDALGGPARRAVERAKDAAPAVGLAIAYTVAYRLVGAGARASGGYHDPIGDPLGFARVLVTRLPILLGDAILGVPAEWSMVLSPGKLALVGLIALGFVALGWRLTAALATERERAALRWLVPASLLATVVGATGFPSGRVLVVPNLGLAALLAVLVTGAFSPGRSRAVRVAFAAALALVHVVIAPVETLGAIAKLRRGARASEAIAEQLATAAEDERVFVVASDPYAFFYPRGILADTRPKAVKCLVPLSAARSSHRFTLVDEHTLRIETLDRPMLDGTFDALFRAPDRPLAEGDDVRTCGARVRVLAVRDGHPTIVEARFDRPFSDVALLAWTDRRFEPLALSVGATTEVRWSPGPLGL